MNAAQGTDSRFILRERE